MLLLAALAIGCTKSPEREPGDFERMRVQQRDEPYAPSELFALHEQLRHLPSGTVSRESGADTGAIGSGTRDGREVTAVPIEITPDLLSLGQKAYGVYCAVCHGAAGYGGSTVAENMGAPRPPSLRSTAVRALPAGTLFSIETRGIGRMPSYAPELTPTERWAVVAYIGQLQHGSASTPDARDDSLRAIRIRSIDSALAAERRQ